MSITDTTNISFIVMSGLEFQPEKVLELQYLTVTVYSLI